MNLSPYDIEIFKQQAKQLEDWYHRKHHRTRNTHKLKKPKTKMYKKAIRKRVRAARRINRSIK